MLLERLKKLSVALIIASFATGSGLFFYPADAIALSSIIMSSSIEQESTENPSPEDVADMYVPGLDIKHSSRAAVVLETSRQRQLYNKNGFVRQNIPTASKIMTALIACERLPLDTQVTISKVAADADGGKPAADGIILETGDKYSVEYLLLRMFYYNSDAAALAIAEQISGVEDLFVEVMNARADNLELADTVFMNVTGKPAYRNSDSPAPTDMNGDPDYYNSGNSQTSLQYTTAYDLAILVNSAMLDTDFANLIYKDSEYLVLEGQKLVSMQNEIYQIWALSDRNINGAFYAEYSGYTSMVAIGRSNDINMVIVTAGGNKEERYNDLLRIQKGCSDAYITAILVEAGEKFSGEQEQTIDGEPFGLVFNKTVYYVRPVDDIFLRPTVRYNSFGPHSRPIQRSMTAGQVIFELEDGTRIAVDVNPDRQILSTNTFLDRALNELQNNRNLSLVIFLSSALLILLMLFNVFLEIKKIINLVRLLIWEKRSQS